MITNKLIKPTFIEAFKKAKAIKFNSYITNEEALILQKIADKTGATLVNKDAYNYKKFLKAYSEVSGQSLYSSSLTEVHDSNFIISVGSYLKSDLPNARYAMNNTVVTNTYLKEFELGIGPANVAAY